MKTKQLLKNGIITDNPIFSQAIGMCPTLAVTTSAENGLGMGLATTAVLICSNLVVSLVRNFIPDKVRIPSFIIIMATFATLVQFLLKAYFPAIDAALGLFIPLIAVNCLIFARAESFAAKNNPYYSIIDGIGMGAGFTVGLVAIGVIREVLGAGSIFGIMLLPEAFPRTIMMILSPGAFLTLGVLMAAINYFKNKKIA